MAVAKKYNKRAVIKAGARYASNYVPYASTAMAAAKTAGQLYRGYKTYKKYSSKPASTPNVKEKQLETQIAGGHGITQATKVFGKQVKKLPLSAQIQKQAARNGLEKYQGGLIACLPNEQVVETPIGIMDGGDFVDIMGSDDPNAYKKLFIERYISHIEVNNTNNSPCMLKIFVHTPKDKTSENVYERFKEGLDRKYNTSTDMEKQIHHNLNESGTLQKFYKQTYCKQVILSPGEVFYIKFIWNVNKQISNDTFMNPTGTASTNTIFVPDLSYLVTFQARGFTSLDTGTASGSSTGRQGVINPCQIAWTHFKKIVYRKWDSSGPLASTYSVTKRQAITAVSNIQHQTQETGAGASSTGL